MREGRGVLLRWLAFASGGRNAPQLATGTLTVNISTKAFRTMERVPEQPARIAVDPGMTDSGWTIDEPATESEVASGLRRDDLDALEFSVSVDGVVVHEGIGIEGAIQAARDLGELPTSATFTERLCYGLAFAAGALAVGIMAPSALMAFNVTAAVGVVTVNRRVGLGPLD